MLKMKKLASVMVASTIALSVCGSLAVNAEPFAEDNVAVITAISDDTLVPYSTTVTEYYNTSSYQEIGKFVASTSTVYLEFGASSVGAVALKFHENSYNGPVIQTILPPSQGTTTTTVTTHFSVSKGTTYYITAETTGGYLATSGSFQITY